MSVIFLKRCNGPYQLKGDPTDINPAIIPLIPIGPFPSLLFFLGIYIFTLEKVVFVLEAHNWRDDNINFRCNAVVLTNKKWRKYLYALYGYSWVRINNRIEVTVQVLTLPAVFPWTSWLFFYLNLWPKKYRNVTDSQISPIFQTKFLGLNFLVLIRGVPKIYRPCLRPWLPHNISGF